MKKIIVTNTGDTTVVNALLNDPALDVVVVTEERFAGTYPEGTTIAFVDSLNEPYRSVEQAQAQVDLSDRHFVVSLSERAALTAGCLRSMLGLPGAGFDVILNCTNKYVMKRRFTAAGLRTADYQHASTAGQVRAAIATLGLPVVIKPIMGAGADAMMVVRDERALEDGSLDRYVERLANPKTTSEKAFPVLVESMLPLTGELHCDGFVADDEIQYARVSRYLRPVLDYEGAIFGSYTLDAADPVAAQVLSMHTVAVEAVGLRAGPTHFEVLEVGGELFAGELASRPGGGGIRRMLELRDGHDSREAMIRSSLAETYTWEPSGADGEIAQFMLPSKRGTVESISTPDDLLAIPAVREADVRLSPGDEVDGLMDSSSVSGLVFASVRQAEDVERVLRELDQAFVLTVDR